MEVILIKDVDNLGSAHELVSVRPGYARNYLIPQKFAIEANKTNRKILAEKEKVKQKKEEALLAEISKVEEALTASAIQIGAKVGDTGNIFGSVTTIQLARAIREQKSFEIDRRRIEILDEVKTLGTYNAEVNFGPDKVIAFEFEVIAE